MATLIKDSNNDYAGQGGYPRSETLKDRGASWVMRGIYKQEKICADSSALFPFEKKISIGNEFTQLKGPYELLNDGKARQTVCLDLRAEAQLFGNKKDRELSRS